MKTYELKSERVARLREEALAKEPGVCVERARYLTKAYKENEEKSKYIKRALAVKEVLEKLQELLQFPVFSVVHKIDYLQ